MNPIDLFAAVVACLFCIGVASFFVAWIRAKPDDEGEL